jgi:hypothetical protein
VADRLVTGTTFPAGDGRGTMSRIKTLAGSRVGVASVAAVLAAVVVGGVGWASIPDSGGFIHGCYKTGGTNHKLSIIDDSVTASCPHGVTVHVP